MIRMPCSLTIVGTLLLSLAGKLGAEPVRGSFELTIQHRNEAGKAVKEKIAVDPAKTAVVVVDMWDRHWCKTYTARVANLVPRMNKTLQAARKLGIQIVFAPSDVANFYKDYPQRKAMRAIPRHPVPKRVAFDPPANPGPTDCCECGPDQPCKKKSHGHWSRQHPDLRMAEGDLIGDCNNGRELLNLCAQRNINTLVYMGVASNMCVQYRAFGIRNMKSHALKAIVCADLVEAITANGLGPDKKARDPNFTPAKGTARIQRHIERHIAPTFESRQLIAAAGMDPHADDKRPHVVFVIAEQEYKTPDTLPALAKRHLEKDFRCTFVHAKGDHGADRNDVPGLDAMYDADLLVLSMRRRALPVVQMDHLERYIRSGKPIVALRVSIVPFQCDPKDRPDGHVIWQAFDQEVLGCHYHGYDSRSRRTGCDVWVVEGAEDHPILNDIDPKGFHSASWIYHLNPLAKSTTLLMQGRWAKDAPAEPIAFVNTYRGARVFYTSLGHPDDFKISQFNRMMVNAIRWALNRSVD